MKRGVWLASAVALFTSAAPGPAHAGRDDIPGRVVFARGGSLWLTDARGKSKAVEVATLPAGEVRLIRTDAGGGTLVVEIGGRWYSAALPTPGAPPATLAELPCGAGPARLSQTARFVLCASPDGQARLVRLGDGKTFDRAAPAAATSLVERDGVRRLVWTETTETNVVKAAPLAKLADEVVLAPEAPVRGFLAAPDGSRGVGVYRARPLKPAGAPERDELFGFALDGTTGRRRLIRDGVVIDWSWDSRWLLVQDGDKACIARATGGQFKCWKGYTAGSIAPDGAWALVLGTRSDATTGGGDAEEGKGKGKGKGEEAEGDAEGEGQAEGEAEGGEEELDGAIALPKGPMSLFRAKLNGPYTEKPALIETVVDGAAAWLPATSTSP